MTHVAAEDVPHHPLEVGAVVGRVAGEAELTRLELVDALAVRVVLEDVASRQDAALMGESVAKCAFVMLRPNEGRTRILAADRERALPDRLALGGVRRPLRLVDDHRRRRNDELDLVRLGRAERRSGRRGLDRRLLEVLHGQ